MQCVGKFPTVHCENDRYLTGNRVNNTKQSVMLQCKVLSVVCFKNGKKKIKIILNKSNNK